MPPCHVISSHTIGRRSSQRMMGMKVLSLYSAFPDITLVTGLRFGAYYYSLARLDCQVSPLIIVGTGQANSTVFLLCLGKIEQLLFKSILAAPLLVLYLERTDFCGVYDVFELLASSAPSLGYITPMN